MDKLAIASIAVLSLVPNLNYQTPTLETHQSDTVVSSFIIIGKDNKQQVKHTFPDRTVEYNQAKSKDEEKRLEAVRAEQSRTQALIAEQAKTTPTTPVNVPQPVLSGDDAMYKSFIYNHESGNNPTRANGSGCLGIGQACPGSKLLAVCPTLDYACEDAFFTSYAIGRYGSWAGAYSFWLGHHWW